ncbi:hypothetical protein SBA6_100006 [Candidatus Sulfopaludibacter sp. SbA6]|nr:hypothetical protein SBA6_100006 [Candidatus Sulfopaludibacter sp. SbA6]
MSYCQTFSAQRRVLPAPASPVRLGPEPSTRYGIPSLPTAGAAFHCGPANTVNGGENASTRNRRAYRSSEPHYARYRADGQTVTRGLLSQMFAAVGSELIETSAPVVGREAPLTLDPAIQLKPLESRVKRTFFDAQQIVGQLLNELRDGIPMQMAPHQYFENEHVQRAGQKVGLRFLCSHRQSDYRTTDFSSG